VNQQVLITGATGFLGGAMAFALADAGASVRALARSPQKAERLRRRGIEVVQGDLTDYESLKRATAGCERVFHVAVSYGSLLQQRAANVEGTRLVARAAAEAGAERILHISSIAVYGNNVRGLVRESTPPAPGAFAYAISKTEGEGALINEVCRADSLGYTILRPGMIYGPGSQPWTAKMYSLARLRPTPWFGDGSGTTHPIYVDDVVGLALHAADHTAARGQVFNVTPDPAPSWRTFLGAYQQIAGHDRWLGAPPSLIRGLTRLIGPLTPKHSMLRDAPEMVDFATQQTTFAMQKARDLLGWQPATDLETGIQNCIPWLREQGLLR
jgi:nucleoside-diphosphate-sugar epimerase